MSTFKKIPFNDLPLSVRERLWGSLGAEGDPAAVHWRKGSRDWWIAAGVFAVIALGVSLYIVFWLMDEDSRKAPWFDREIYLALAGTLWLFFTLAIGLAYRLIWVPPPHKWGVQLLTGGYVAFIDRYDVWVQPIAEMDRPTIVNRYRNGAYQGSSLQLSVGGQPVPWRFHVGFANQAEPEEVVARLHAARQLFKEKVATGDPHQLAMIDPFWECTLSGQWTAPFTHGPHVPTPAAPLRWARWIAPVLMALFCAGGYFGLLTMLCEQNPRCDTPERLDSRYRR